MAKEVLDDIRADLERAKPRLDSRRRSDSKGPTNTKLGRVLPRYLAPPLSSCHDSCKSRVPTCNESQHGTATKITNRRHSIPAAKPQRTPIDENKTKGMPWARQKGVIIPRQTKQDEENVPERTLYVVEEHREDPTNRKPSPARGEILEGRPLHEDDSSPRKAVVQCMFGDGEEDSVKMLSGEKMAENKIEAAEKDVKTLIGVFESVIALQ